MQQILSFLPACLWGFFACLAFGLVFNIHGWGILICGLGGALGWFVYQVVEHMANNDIMAAFLSAVVIAVYSELMARIRQALDEGTFEAFRAQYSGRLDRPVPTNEGSGSTK